MAVNVIDYITMASTGDAQDFGDLSTTIIGMGTTGSAIRGIFGGGQTPTVVNTMEYITIASAGDVTDFGDLTVARNDLPSTMMSNATRGVFAGGTTPGDPKNEIDYITITSTGDATDFGDLTAGNYGGGTTSDFHGGLQT